MRALRLLDLFSGAGGAAAGYARAGFTDILGIDHRPQKRYPFRFLEADALEFLASVKPGDYDLIHASPPCQAFSAATPLAARRKHPDLIAPVRQLLQQSGCEWVIENVVGAPLRHPILLCGLMFGLKVFRHRLFESSSLLLGPPHHAHHQWQGGVRIGERSFVTVVDDGCGRPWGARIGRDGFCTVAGGGNSGVRDRSGGRMIRRRPEHGVEGWRRSMGIDWMSRDELAQAIPPAFTEYVGARLLEPHR